MEDIREESIAIEKRLNKKEQEIIANDKTITSQIRQMLSKLENEELLASLQKVELQQDRISNMTSIIIILGVISLLVIVGFLVLILKDLTKSQVYRQKLEKEKAYSDTLLKSKEQFMLSITHDLKSPLGSIIGFSQLTERVIVSPRQKHYLKNINQAAGHILRLINDLLDFTRLESGKLKIEKIQFNLKALVNEVVSGFYPLAATKNLQLELQFKKLIVQGFPVDF